MVTSQLKPTAVVSLCLLNSGKAKHAQCRESPVPCKGQKFASAPLSP